MPYYLFRPVAEGATPRVVKAANAARAIRHIIDTDFDVTTASNDDLAGVLEAGVKVERATAED